MQHVHGFAFQNSHLKDEENKKSITSWEGLFSEFYKSWTNDGKTDRDLCTDLLVKEMSDVNMVVD